MSTPMTIEYSVHFERRARGRVDLQVGEAPEPVCEAGRVPRVAKLLALAHRFDGLLREGVVKDYADLGRLGGVTRARISQIMSTLLLAPDIQEAILFMPRTQRGRDRVRLMDLQPIAQVVDWRVQRKLWAALTPITAEPSRDMGTPA